MFKKILFISLVVSFSTTVISKEKVFLDYGFLKDISTRTDKACELNASGKTVKADKLLKEISQELTNYLSKLGTFSLSKECLFVWINGNSHGALECLPQINFKWPFYDDPISDKVLEQMESFTDNKNEIVFFSGKFKLHYHKISKSYYDNFQGQILCSSYVKTQQINIFAIPISVTKGQEKKWSAFQGNMTWEEAKIKCESIGMRLPTASELFYAPKHVWDKDTDVAEDGETSFYWDSKKIIHELGEYITNVNTDELESDKHSVRCIAGKEFQFKK